MFIDLTLKIYSEEHENHIRHNITEFGETMISNGGEVDWTLIPDGCVPSKSYLRCEFSFPNTTKKYDTTKIAQRLTKLVFMLDALHKPRI